MRAKEFLIEKADSSVAKLKTQIIGQVQKTDDGDLLQKIYTALNKTGLVNRIGLVLDRDTDTKGYVKQLVDMIIEVPGTYEEKAAFVKGYPTGYVDIKKMLSGEYVKFDDLLVGPKGTPLEFIHKVFNTLKQVTFGGAKGPGEFALAVLSPHIKITGKGDLHIGKDVIEVKAAAGESGKASGGRVGTPGMLRSDNVKAILAKYCKNMPADGESLNLKQLSGLMNANALKPQQKTKLATELFNYIFKGQADISGLVDAVVSGSDPNPYYLKANYEVYQKESGFTGMMLINFPSQSLKYFKDPLQMAREVYSFSVYLISANPGFTARQILSQVTLKPVKEPLQTPKLTKTKPSAPTANLQQKPIVKPKAVGQPMPAGQQNQQKPLKTSKIPMGQNPVQGLSRTR